MKQHFTIIFLCTVCMAKAQTDWHITGNAGITATNFIGTTDAKDFIFKTNNVERGRVLSSGAWRFGIAGNFAKIDSTGKLTFSGTGAYQVGGNKYVFQYSGNPNYGLFYNSTTPQYEFRNGSATPVFTINANTGNGIFNGNLRVGAYTLPAIDGASGQVLKTNGAGSLTWSSDNNTTYSAGSGISISGTTITNTGANATL